VAFRERRRPGPGRIGGQTEGIGAGMKKPGLLSYYGFKPIELTFKSNKRANEIRGDFEKRIPLAYVDGFFHPKTLVRSGQYCIWDNSSFQRKSICFYCSIVPTKSGSAIVGRFEFSVFFKLVFGTWLFASLWVAGTWLFNQRSANIFGLFAAIGIFVSSYLWAYFFSWAYVWMNGLEREHIIETLHEVVKTSRSVNKKKASR
jgi:hypothetical protein